MEDVDKETPPHRLLMGMQTDLTTVEVSIEV